DKEVPYYGDMCDGTGRCPDCTEKRHLMGGYFAAPIHSLPDCHTGECKHEDIEHLPTEGWFWCFDCENYIEDTHYYSKYWPRTDRRKGQQRKQESAYDCGFEAGYSLRQYEEQEEKHPNGLNCPNPNKEGLCGCCATCGGSGVKCQQPSQGCASIHIQSQGCCFHCNFWKPCPNCTGLIRYKRSDGAEIVKTDQRKGQQRKESPTFMKDTNLVWVGYLPEYGGLFYVEDRRIKERRSEILIGSLKAMRPQDD
ncbi:hypothetical protein LCGC14_1143420, partial [marine sediment metagenome]